jgi:hypothetical protein
MKKKERRTQRQAKPKRNLKNIKRKWRLQLDFLLRTFCEKFCIQMRKPKQPCIHISMEDKPGAFTKTRSVWFDLQITRMIKISELNPPHPNPQIGDDLGYSWPYCPVGVYKRIDCFQVLTSGSLLPTGFFKTFESKALNPEWSNIDLCWFWVR